MTVKKLPDRVVRAVAGFDDMPFDSLTPDEQAIARDYLEWERGGKIEARVYLDQLKMRQKMEKSDKDECKLGNSRDLCTDHLPRHQEGRTDRELVKEGVSGS